MHVLAHAGGHTLGQNIVETLLLLAGVAIACAAVRLRNVRVFGRAGPASGAVGILAVAALVLAFVVPSMLGIKVASVRPSTNAKIAILNPRPNQVLRGNPATIRVRVRVMGARIVSQTSTHLSPDKGHIHLYLDGMLVTMAYTTSTTIYAYPDSHRLQAQFVAVDHGPFSPPVTASLTFRVVP